jgi:serine phosphatase RsbU (regulator of sigma subunit)
MELDQLWSQFRNDTRSSYRLYSREVKPYEPRDARRTQPMHHFLHTAKQFFWAILMKLSPAKRVVLLAALVMLAMGDVRFRSGNNTDVTISLHGIGVLLILMLLVLEIADRVTMKRDLEIAREIQGWLLPAGPPAVAQLDIAFSTRPANTVAGDYYDAFPRRVGVAAGGEPPMVMIVADVAGKSIPAAMLMATLHASLHTLALTAESLADLAAGLNRYCCEHSNEGRRFTTAFVAEFDPARRRLASINAGHNAPVLLRANGMVERLEAGGIPFGISTALPYTVDTRELDSGDVLFVFTDGLIEAENGRQQEFGEAALLPLLNAYRALPSTEIIARVLQQVNAFVGDTPQHDDITCMVVRMK